jgi:sugar phosphate permease
LFKEEKVAKQIYGCANFLGIVADIVLFLGKGALPSHLIRARVTTWQEENLQIKRNQEKLNQSFFLGRLVYQTVLKWILMCLCNCTYIYFTRRAVQ